MTRSPSSSGSRPSTTVLMMPMDTAPTVTATARPMTRAPIVVGPPPLTRDEPFLLKALQGGVERALVHIEHAFRDLLDAQADAPAVHRREGERLENEQVERAPERVRLRACGHGSSGECVL